MSSRAGYVLVGGKSSRMGRDKPLLPFHDSTLGESVAEAVRAVCGAAYFVGVTRRVGLGGIPDVYPGEGPLGGILTALQFTQADWNLVVACDMPGLRTDFLGQLLDRAERSEADALVPIGPLHLEPLCAAYHHRCLPGLYRAFERGTRKIAAALAEIRAETWQVPEELSCFQNVNTPEDWTPYER